ncbi:39S ribosomal protein L3, mitochondrial [Venturia canescens]|uniref:39S ribosomal protein L3, mitochondrial n=1 Tax=Venturia canescens TaxID=32260 RepID=UPI001C9C813A|nr:39S ribosomal protein L3, mitochondrial [Venturia canescens]XP_043274807.1 39S ribosomal protein L3, mitochondrial [Venturia canescens]
MATLFKGRGTFSIVSNFLKPRIDLTNIPNRAGPRLNIPKKQYPPWLPKQHRVLHREEVTRENAKFVQEVIEDKWGPRDIGIGMTNHNSPLKAEPIEPQMEWAPDSTRTGVIAKKLGIYPMWLKNGKRVLATLLQVADNHVIKYIPPEDYNPKIGKKRPKRRLGCLVIGAESEDPQKFTKEYCGMFTEAGVMPKKLLARFLVTPNAALQPGTPLFAAHYKAGTFVDIRGKTVDRGFQGVMKRWGFHGQPATHGQTKTHRRPGNIGSGGTKARVMPGTKMPGHMGNRYRILRGVQILRVNTKYNVLWVKAQNLPGETNTLLQIYDTLLPTKKLREPCNFPTYVPKPEETLPEETYADDVHPFNAPSIEFKEA